MFSRVVYHFAFSPAVYSVLHLYQYYYCQCFFYFHYSNKCVLTLYPVILLYIHLLVRCILGIDYLGGSILSWF